jgi:hypothetical protein
MSEMEEEDVNSSPTGRVVLGTIFLYASVAILFLAIVSGSSSLSFMPRSWFTNRWSWYLAGFVGFFASIILLRSKPATEGSQGGRTRGFKRVVLYTRAGCHLCDDAKLVLMKYQPPLPMMELVDITNNAALIEKYGDCVPVVEIDGKVRFRGRVNEVLLQRLIDGESLAPDEGDESAS